MAASAAQTRVKEEVEKSIEKLERDQLRGLQVSKNLLDQQGCFKVAGYSAVKPWIVIPLTLRRFFGLHGSHTRPGQGFWVYGFPGHFNSGIWYFLVKIRV